MGRRGARRHRRVLLALCAFDPLAQREVRAHIAVHAHPGDGLPGERGEQIWEASTSLIFKETRVHRFVDEQAHALVYLAWSTRLIEGSPHNALAVVPLAR